MAPEHLDVLEFLIRGAAAGTFVALALAVMRGVRTSARLTAALFFVAAAAHTLTQSRTAFASLGLAIGPIWAFSVMAAGLFWAFAMELFGDNKRLKPTRFVPAGGLLAVGALAAAAPPATARALWLAQNLIGGALLLHVLVVIWTGWRGDLVEERRVLRGPLVGVAALYALAVVGVQSAEFFLPRVEQLSFLAALSLLAMGIVGAAVFLRADPALFGAARAEVARAIEPKDLKLLERLRQAFDDRELWRQEGLTIGILADRLGTPEHQLRKLINEGLGYRNFAAFINERRIEAAKLALCDPAVQRKSVSTIAFEVGFGSLGPFNRAFREATGQTPSDWRKAAEASWSISEKDI